MTAKTVNNNVGVISGYQIIIDKIQLNEACYKHVWHVYRKIEVKLSNSGTRLNKIEIPTANQGFINQSNIYMQKPTKHRFYYHRQLEKVLTSDCNLQ